MNHPMTTDALFAILKALSEPNGHVAWVERWDEETGTLERELIVDAGFDAAKLVAALRAAEQPADLCYDQGRIDGYKDGLRDGIAVAPKIEQPAPEKGETYRHKKSDKICRVVAARAEVQTDTPLTDYAAVVVYHEPNGYWVRPVSEFNERFVKIVQPSHPADAGSGEEVTATPEGLLITRLRSELSAARERLIDQDKRHWETNGKLMADRDSARQEVARLGEAAKAEQERLATVVAELTPKTANDDYNFGYAVACHDIRTEILHLCPRPTGRAPDGLTAAQCIARGECGCDNRAASLARGD